MSTLDQMADQLTLPTQSELNELLGYLSEQELGELDRLTSDAIWVPLPGPQTQALESKADILLYGGAAGGGKTDLAIGLAVTEHSNSIIFRREGTQHKAIIRRMIQLLGGRDGFNSQQRIWTLHGNRTVEFGSAPHLGDEWAYQGQPHDLIVFDEVTHFIEEQVRTLMGWLRTTDGNQRTRVVMTSNPPTDQEGEWVIDFFGPWLNPEHPNPAKPGELRWYSVLDGEEVETGPEPFMHNGEKIYPQSRTFIPAKVQDNPYLMGTNYESQLQAMPEPLRSQMLEGDFLAHKEDSPYQVIPTEWIKAAQDRWTPERPGEMDSIGVDPARGGKDETIIARRHGSWFDEALAYPGSETPDGPAVGALVLTAARDGAPIHVEITGIGSSVYDHLATNNLNAEAINPAESTKEMDRTQSLRFRNVRALLWWRMREALDPKNNEQIALPPDPKLKADLCTPMWKLTTSGIQVESKEDIKKRLGRSTDRGDAYIMALKATEKAKHQNLMLEPGRGRPGGWMR